MKLNREFKIGFFGIIMIAALYWGVNFLKGTDLFSSTVHYYAAYDQVNGLQPSASIVIKGFKVGSVSDIAYDPQRSKNVVVEFAVKSKYRIPRDTKARIFSDGIMSGKSVELELGSSTDFLHEGDTLFSEINKDFLEVAGSEFEFLKQRANDLIGEVLVTLKSINALIGENSSSIRATLDNMAAISGDLRGVLSDQKANLGETMANLNALSHSLERSSGQIERIIGNTADFTDSLSKAQIPSAVAELRGAVGSLGDILGKIESGEGTLGMLVADKALYDSLVASSANLSALLEDLRKHPSRYVNISVFGRRARD